DIEKSLRDQIELLQSTNEHLDVKVKSEAQVSTQYMQELTDVKDQLRAMTTELSVTAARRDALEIDLSRARTTISTLTTEKMMLEEENNQLLLENGDVKTGSGKTYTMEGDIDGPNRGIIPRATDQIFDTIEELKARDWSYEVKVSILEIYNEKFVDLINPDETAKTPEIYADPTTKEPVFVNLYRATAEKPSEVQALIRLAQKRRHVAATKCNERSSRSHCVFWMQFCGKNSATEETTAGAVYLVDLAGSERSKVSGATGTRLKETNDINVSLSALGRVFVSIMAKDSHIPYRDSKLTHCLQPCLGGSAKVLMMVNLSPFDVNESLNTLRFAKKVNQCHIGTARKRC
ncbi:unnamed protein product, partial [Cyprideis torosa]